MQYYPSPHGDSVTVQINSIIMECNTAAPTSWTWKRLHIELQIARVYSKHVSKIHGTLWNPKNKLSYVESQTVALTPPEPAAGEKNRKSYLAIDISRSIFLTEILTECSRNILKYEFMQGKCLLLSSISKKISACGGLWERKGVAHYALLVYNYIFFFRDCCFP